MFPNGLGNHPIAQKIVHKELPPTIAEWSELVMSVYELDSMRMLARINARKEGQKQWGDLFNIVDKFFGDVLKQNMSANRKVLFKNLVVYLVDEVGKEYYNGAGILDPA